MPSDVSEIDYLKHLGRAIEAALSDKLQEIGCPPTLFFVDADFVFGAIYSVKDAVHESTDITTPSPIQINSRFDAWVPSSKLATVSRTLWACGLSCTAHILWPHILELRSKIANEKNDTNFQGILRKMAERRSQLPGSTLGATLAELQATSRPESAIETISSSLSISDFLLAQAVALDTWEKKRHFVGESLELGEPHGMPVESLLNEPDCFELAPAIYRAKESERSTWWEWIRRRFGGGRQVDRNALSDAVAVLALDRLGRERLVTNQAVRFHTQTKAIIAAIDSLQWQGRFHLRVQTKDDGVLNYGVLDDINGPFRSARYMFLRTVIPALRFADAREAAVTSGVTISLDTLRELLNSIKSAVTSASMASNPEIVSHFFHSVSDEAKMVIDDAQRAGLFSLVWRTKRGRLIGQLSSQTKWFSNQQNILEKYDDVVDKALAGKSADIARQAHSLRVSANNLDETLRALNKKVVSVSGMRPDTVTHLSGIGRWVLWLRDISNETELANECRRLLALFADQPEDGIRECIEGIKSAKIELWLSSMFVLACNGGSKIVVSLTTGNARLHPGVTPLLDVLKDIWLGWEGLEASLDNELENRVWRCENLVSWGSGGLKGNAAKVAGAWGIFYACHGYMMRAFGSPWPTANHVVNDHLLKAGGWIERANSQLSSDERRTCLADAASLLIAASLGDPARVVQQVHRFGPQAIYPSDHSVDWSQNRYLVEARLWFEMTERYRLRNSGFIVQPSWGTEVARAKSEFDETVRLSQERYWSDHRSAMTSRVGT